jgi:hypothetical protein
MSSLAASGGNSVTALTVIVALAAGAIGSVVTAAFAFGARLSRIGREIESNDRALRILDRHLETWVSDATVDLVRELRDIRNDLNARGLFHSGEYGFQVALAKERALHRYRDQERTAQSHADEIQAREGQLHTLVRAWRFATLDPDLRAPARVLPVLTRWAAPVTQHLGPNDPPRPLDSDPRDRTFESTLAMLDTDPNALV